MVILICNMDAIFAMLSEGLLLRGTYVLQG